MEIKPAVLHLQIELNKTCGVTRSILRVIRNSHNFEHYVISLGGDAVNRFDGTNCKIIHADRNSIIGSLKIFFTIIRFIKKHKITIINSHHRYFDLMSIFFKYLTGVKTITTVHSKVFNRKSFSYKADHLITVSNSIKDHIVLQFESELAKISVINNFIDQNEIIQTIPHDLLLKELGIPDDSIILGYFGRLDIKEKGVDILIDAFNKISQEFKNVYLILAGAGVDESILREKVRKMNIPVKFVGEIENIWDYIYLADIIILASRIDPFPLTMMEAGLAGKAFIGSDADGIPEFIDDNINGMLFCKEDICSLYNKMKELISDKNLRLKLGNNLQQKVIQNYVPGKIIPLLENIYRTQIVNNSKSQRELSLKGMKKNILGIDVLFAGYEELLSTFFTSGIRTYTCVNHHYLNIAYEQKDYMKDLKSFGLIFPDGLGTKLAAKLLYDGGKIDRVTGSDFYPILLNDITAKGLTIYILGDSQKILEKAIERLKELYPGIKICGSHQGFIDLMDRTVVDDINQKSPYLLLVGLGVPHQENWVMLWKDKINVEKILVIGGWLRVMSGDRKRGPVWVRKMGLEWFIRLVSDPRRSWKRYIVGIPLFLYRVCKQKIYLLLH